MSDPREQILQRMKHYRAQAGAVPREEVLEWLRVDDLEVMCAVHDFLSGREADVEPPLEAEDWMPHYFGMIRRCMIENPQSRDDLDSHVLSRYQAAYALQAWFRHNWEKRKEVDQKWFAMARGFLKEMVLSQDGSVRTAITHGILEHLFAIRSIRKLFSEWKDDPILRPMYEEACE